MALTTYIDNDGSGARDESALSDLVDLYERELVMYDEILELSQHQQTAVREGRSLEDVRKLLARKQTLLDMIRHMEGHHDRARRHWQDRKHQLSGELSARLQEILKAVSDTVEEIMRLENETDRLFFAMAEA